MQKDKLGDGVGGGGGHFQKKKKLLFKSKNIVLNPYF